jgi:cytochrome c biogenesis protein CcmG, thiol:disulfide interchange protein DsbE
MSNATPRRWALILPLLALLLLSIPLFKGLGKDTRLVPSPFVGKALPILSGPQLLVAGDFSTASLAGKPFILNVWASWCPECPREHPVFNAYAKTTGAIPVVGLAYRDKAEDASAWIAQFGNPFSVILHDPSGRMGIDLGVTGAPETFFVDAAGKVRFKQTGGVTPALMREKVAELQR